MVDANAPLVKGRKKNFYQLAQEKFERELRQNTHRVHLLLLLAHALRLNRQCNNDLVKGYILSLLPNHLSACPQDTASLSRLLGWFTDMADGLVKGQPSAAELGCPQLSSVQLLVSLLRLLECRARLVLVLDPSPYKKTVPRKRPPPPSSSKDNSKKGKRRKESQVKETALGEDVTLEEDGEPPKKRKCRQRLCTNSGDATSLSVAQGKPMKQKSTSLSLSKKLKSKLGNSVQPNKEASVQSRTTLQGKVPLEESKGNFYDGTTSWVEVYSEKVPRKWITLHLPSNSVGQAHLAELACPKPLIYVVALDNRGCVRDVTPCYAANWCTRERKEQISEDWWNRVLGVFSPPQSETEVEDEAINALLLSRPLPLKTQHFRGHPLYVLKSQLLKYEALYPAYCEILGYCEGEPVFSRSCVYTLHCREQWLKEGKVVQKGEAPYKEVKTMSVRKRRSAGPESEKKVELFGKWQTEDYIPPPVENGRVPRNEFGNIEVFKPSMVPRGGCHLRIAGIQKVLRSLNIDYASAVVGWEFKGCYSYPVIEGVVIAEEHRKLAMDAWREKQHILIKDKEERRIKLILDRWVKLVKGIFILERVKRRFSTGNN